MTQMLHPKGSENLSRNPDGTHGSAPEPYRSRPAKHLGIDNQHDVAEAFKAMLWVYTPTITDDGAGLGVAVANERGYSPVPSFHYQVETYDEAATEADRLNRAKGIGVDAAAKIIISSMRAP